MSSAIATASLCHQHCPQGQSKTQSHTPYCRENEHYFSQNQHKTEVLLKQLEPLKNQDKVFGCPGTQNIIALLWQAPSWKASDTIFPFSPYVVSGLGHHLRRGWYSANWVSLSSPLVPETQQFCVK